MPIAARQGRRSVADGDSIRIPKRGERTGGVGVERGHGSMGGDWRMAAQIKRGLIKFTRMKPPPDKKRRASSILAVLPSPSACDGVRSVVVAAGG